MQEVISHTKDFPLTSVLLPVYNGGEYLRQSVSSVLQQENRSFELLILDDCSTDDSYAYLQSLTDPRISVYRNQENKGLFYNLNFLAKKSTSPLLKLWSQDDIMHPGCLAGFISFFHDHPQCGFVYCATGKMDAGGNIKSSAKEDKTPSIITPQLHARIAYFTGSIAGNIANVCISREAFENVGPFNEQMKISADFEMWVRLAKDHDTGFIRQELVTLRDHQGQLSRNETLYINHIREDLQVYTLLNSIVSAGLRREGKAVLRDHKLRFYYNVMLRSLAKRKFKTALVYFRTLRAFDNFFLLTIQYLRNSMRGKRIPAFIRNPSEHLQQ